MTSRVPKIFLIVLINSTILSSVLAKSEDECKSIVEKSSTMRLKKYLFCEYDARERSGITLENGTTYVLFGLAPKMAIFNEVSGNLELFGWMFANWEDEHLKWEPSSFENISSIRIYSNQIWVPDIAVISAGNEDSNEYGLPNSACYLQDNGMIFCTLHIRHTIRCQTDFTHWPFDRQNCSLVLSSWSHTQENIRFVEQANETVYMDYFKSNGEWRLAVSRVFFDQRKAHFFANATSSSLSIDFILDRVHNQLSGRYVSPILIMMVMTLTTLWLDPRSIERLAVASLNPVIHLFCIQDLNWALPHNGSTVPGILLFYANSLVLATIGLLLTFVLGTIQETKIPPPRWISSATASILRSKVGQILLLSMLDPKVAAEIEPDANDAGDLVRSDAKEPAWGYFAILCGWITFISFLFIYIILYAVLIPNSSMRTPITDIVYSEPVE